LPDDDDGDEDVQEEEAAHDLMVGHSIHVANTKYGLNSDLLRGLSAQAVSLFRNVSDSWHIWMKLKSRQIRRTDTIKPVVLRRNNVASLLSNGCMGVATSSVPTNREILFMLSLMV
jgi:hypothetical protein